MREILIKSGGNINTIFLCTILAFLFLGLLIILRLLSKRGKDCGEIDQMDGREFEYFCAELLKRKGFQEVQVTKASGDYGVDILAEKEGITFAIQCKCYHSSIGVKAVQEAHAGRDYYDCMIGVVLTNQYFTTPAVEAARKLKILLWDRGYLESMMQEG